MKSLLRTIFGMLLSVPFVCLADPAWPAYYDDSEYIFNIPKFAWQETNPILRGYWLLVLSLTSLSLIFICVKFTFASKKNVQQAESEAEVPAQPFWDRHRKAVIVLLIIIFVLHLGIALGSLVIYTPKMTFHPYYNRKMVNCTALSEPEPLPCLSGKDDHEWEKSTTDRAKKCKKCHLIYHRAEGCGGRGGRSPRYPDQRMSTGSWE